MNLFEYKTTTYQTPRLIAFRSIPSVVEIAERRIPNYWGGLKPDTPYKVVNDYEKLVNGRSEHFFLIEDYDNNFREVPIENTYIYNKRVDGSNDFGQHLNS